MKVLLDSCVSRHATEQLKAAGNDVVWGGDWREDPGDEAVLAQASKERRVLVTLDKDFGELAVLHGLKHHGIVRLVNFRASQQGPACLQILALHGDELVDGTIITAEPGRLRVRQRLDTPG